MNKPARLVPFVLILAFFALFAPATKAQELHPDQESDRALRSSEPEQATVQATDTIPEATFEGGEAFRSGGDATEKNAVNAAGADQITVVSPNGGATWKVGREETIEWTTQGVSGDVRIWLYRGNDELVRKIYRWSGSGPATWTVPPYIEPGDDYYIRIFSYENPNVSDRSDGTFTIEAGTGPYITTLSPDWGDKWTKGEPATVHWTSRNVVGNVFIKLLKGEVEFVEYITQGTSDDGSYTWIVPEDLEPRNDYYVSVRSVENNSVWDTAGDFEIGYPNIDLIGTINTAGNAWDVDVAGNYAYVADEYGGLTVADVSNPNIPFEVSTLDVPGEALTVDVEGTFAYVASAGGGLRVVDISSPTNPVEIGSFDTPDDAWGVTISGGYAYVAAESAGLYVLDVSDPANPYEVGSFDTPGAAVNVRVRGDYAYVADYSGGLRIVDISDPEDPEAIGFVSAQEEIWDVDLAGTYAYVADYGLRVIDVSDPADPTEAGSFDASDDAWDVSVSGNYAYIAADNAGMRTISVADPANPSEIGYFDTPDPAYGVTTAGDYTYVAAEESGVYIIRNQSDEDVTPPAVPTGLSATAGDQEVTLTWDPNTESDLAEYRLYRFVLPQQETEYVDDIPAGTTTYTETGLNNGRTHSYWVTAVDDAGNESDFSDEVQVTPEGDDPPAAFTWPVDAPQVSQDYGTYGSVFPGRYHLGIDLVPATNVYDIYAATDGQVVLTNQAGVEHPAYGIYLVIDHGDGLYALYAHLSSRVKSVGDGVDRGEPIGVMGETGDAGGIHLHFDVITRSSQPDDVVAAFDNGYHEDHPKTIGHPDPKSYLQNVRVRVTTSPLNVREGPGTNFSLVGGNTTVSENQEFVAVGPAVDGWRLVYLPYDVVPSTDPNYFDYDRYGWVNNQFLSSGTNAKIQIRVDGEELVADGGTYLNVRSAPNSSSEMLTKVWGGQRFVAFGTPQNGSGSDEPWYKIHLPSSAGASAGWVAGNYISLIDGSSEGLPDAPSGFTASAGQGEVSLSWEANNEEDNVVGYNLYRTTSSFSDPSQATKVNGPSLITGLTYTDTEVNNGTTYHYRLSAVNDVGDESSLSNEVTATPSSDDGDDACPTNPPVGVNPSLTEISACIDELAEEYKVPGLIVRGLLQQESLEWKQFCDEDVADRSACEDQPFGAPVISVDSGRGLTQVTITDENISGNEGTLPLADISAGEQGRNAFTIEVNPSETVSLSQLEVDWVYNLRRGIRHLLAKKAGIAPQNEQSGIGAGEVGSDNRVLENWYNALAFYNGYTGCANNPDDNCGYDRNPNGIRDRWKSIEYFPYQEAVFNALAQRYPIQEKDAKDFPDKILATLPGPEAVDTEVDGPGYSYVWANYGGSKYLDFYVEDRQGWARWATSCDGRNFDRLNDECNWDWNGPERVPATVHQVSSFSAHNATPVQPSTINLSINQSFSDPEQERNYRLMALPGDESVPVASTLEGEDGEDWRVFRDNGQAEDYFVEYDGSAQFNFAPGRGFWVISENAWTSSSTVETVSLSESGTYAIDLHDGWNIVSNPFSVGVDWSDVQAANGVTQTLWRWDGSYQEASSFASAQFGRAYYFFNEQGLSELQLPYPSAAPSSSNVTIASSRHKPSSEVTSALTLTATAKGDSLASQVQVGRAKEAKEGFDARDQYAPPGAFAATRMYLTAPFDDESGHDRLAVEYRSTAGEGHSFDLHLRAEPDQTVTLRAGGLEALSGQEAALVNRRTARFHDLREESTFSVQPAEGTTRFALLVGSASFVEEAADEVVPEESQLLGNYPNPFRSRTTIAYTVAEESRVRLVLYDLLGRKLRTLVDEKQEPGREEVALDAGSLSSGVYLYRLVIGDYQETGKVVLVR